MVLLSSYILNEFFEDLWFVQKCCFLIAAALLPRFLYLVLVMSASLNINFAEFGVSYWNGFLPDETPLAKLSDIYYWEWEAIVERLPLFLRNKYLRRSVDRIQVLSTSHLVSEPEWRRAYLVLAFMTHAYIWEAGGPSQVSQKHERI